MPCIVNVHNIWIVGACLLGGAEEEESVAAAVEDEEEEEVAGGADDEEIMDLFPEEGYEYVLADEEPELLFTMAEEDPEMTLEAVADFERQEDVELEVHAEAMPVALGEVVSGKVRVGHRACMAACTATRAYTFAQAELPAHHSSTLPVCPAQVSRVEEFGVFVEFQHNGKTFNALLERDEAKVGTACSLFHALVLSLCLIIIICTGAAMSSLEKQGAGAAASAAAAAVEGQGACRLRRCLGEQQQEHSRRQWV